MITQNLMKKCLAKIKCSGQTKWYVSQEMQSNYLLR